METCYLIYLLYIKVLLLYITTVTVFLIIAFFHSCNFVTSSHICDLLFVIYLLHIRVLLLYLNCDFISHTCDSIFCMTVHLTLWHFLILNYLTITLFIYLLWGRWCLYRKHQKTKTKYKLNFCTTYKYRYIYIYIYICWFSSVCWRSRRDLLCLQKKTSLQIKSAT